LPFHYLDILAGRAWLERHENGIESEETETELMLFDNMKAIGRRALFASQGFLTPVKTPSSMKDLLPTNHCDSDLLVHSTGFLTRRQVSDVYGHAISILTRRCYLSTSRTVRDGACMLPIVEASVTSCGPADVECSAISILVPLVLDRIDALRT